MTGAVPVLFSLKEKTQQNRLQESIKADDKRETESTDLDLPQVCRCL